MNKHIYRILCSIFLIAIFLLLLSIKSNAATLSVISSAKTVQPGQTFTVTVNISGGAGYATLSANNATLNKAATSFLDNSSETITCIAGNTTGTTITISANAIIGDYKTEKDETRSASASISITAKPAPKPTTTIPKPSTTIKPTTSTNNNKKEEKKDDFYITKLTLKGIKENGEKVDITLSPKFSKNVYKYSCKAESDIQKIELVKDAGNYTKYITVDGLEKLKEGENTITLKLAAKGQKTKTYTIKVTKEVAIVETNNEPQVDNAITENEQTQNEKESRIVSMPLGAFIALEAGIIVVEAAIFCIVFRKKLFNRNH